MVMKDDEEVSITVLTHEQLVDRSRDVAQFAISQCADDDSGPFCLFSSMAVLLAGAASLAVIGKVDPETVVKLLRELLEAHYETERKEAN